MKQNLEVLRFLLVMLFKGLTDPNSDYRHLM